MQNRRRVTAELILLGVTVIWGGTFIVTKTGLSDISPFLLIGIRFLVAFVVVAAVRHRKLMPISRRTLGRGTVLGILLCASYLFQTTGLLFTTASRSGFITYLYAVLIPPLQFLILKKTVSRWNLVGLAVVLTGLLMLTEPGRGGINPGDGMTVLSAIGIAFYIVLLDRFSRLDDAGVLITIQFAVTAAIALLVPTAGWAVGLPSFRFNPTLSLLLAIGYLALFGTVVALGLQNRYQRDTTPVRATIIFAFEPVFAVLFGVLAGESFGRTQMAGATLILFGLLVSELSHFRSVRRVFSQT